MWLPLKNLFFIYKYYACSIDFSVFESTWQKNESCCFGNLYVVSETTWLAFQTMKSVFKIHSCVSRQHVGLYVESKLHGYVDSRFACFYLTGQLESILRKFQLAGVVLVVLKPHVFNLTGQLISKPPKFPTLAATDLIGNWLKILWYPTYVESETGTLPQHPCSIIIYDTSACKREHNIPLLPVKCSLAALK